MLYYLFILSAHNYHWPPPLLPQVYIQHCLAPIASTVSSVTVNRRLCLPSRAVVMITPALLAFLTSADVAYILFVLQPSSCCLFHPERLLTSTNLVAWLCKFLSG